MRDDLLIRVAHSVKPEAFGTTSEAWAAAMNAAWDGDVDTPEVLEVQQAAASAGAWNAVYVLSAVAGLETSVLIDAEGTVFIDWGSPGLVPLRAHVGAMAPFQVWVHTHPRFDAYWSGTDRQSLANGTGVLREALVLGYDGVNRARNLGEDEPEAERISGL
ncbi:MAG: hypothetical protein VXX03_04685, partial [Candidatus Thermoplasmatota archaeon]|nr:hypothetical protein [Candidatus Thermoplasmatota archaeon]